MGSLLLSVFAGAAVLAGVFLLFWLVFSTADELLHHGRRRNHG